MQSEIANVIVSKYKCIQAGFLLFISVLIIAFMTSHATLSYDPPTRYLEGKTLVDHGTLELSPPEDEPILAGIFKGKDDKYYSYFGKGQSIIFAVPYYICSRWLGIESDKIIRSIIALTVFPLTLAATALLFFALLREFQLPPKACYISALLMVFTTGIWQLSKEGQEGNHLAFFYILAAYGLKCYQNRASLKHLAISALAIGMAFLTRSDTAPMVLGYLLFATYLVYQNSKTRYMNKIEPAHFIPGISVILLFTVPALLIYMAINIYCFGNPFSGYKDHSSLFTIPNLIRGLKGYAYSPGRSVLLYNPILLLSIIGFIAFWKDHRSWAYFILFTFTGCLLLHAAYPVFHGNCCWGPRYLIRYFPLLMVPVALWCFTIKLGGLKKGFVIIIASISLVVQIAAVSLHHNREIAELTEVHPNGLVWTMFEPEANILQKRFVYIYEGVRDMVNGDIAEWPTESQHTRSLSEKISDPTLHYLAFWPYHLTYYLPTIKPESNVSLLTATMILVIGVGFGLILVIWGWKTAGKAADIIPIQPPQRKAPRNQEVDQKILQSIGLR